MRIIKGYMTVRIVEKNDNKISITFKNQDNDSIFLMELKQDDFFTSLFSHNSKQCDLLLLKEIDTNFKFILPEVVGDN